MSNKYFQILIIVLVSALCMTAIAREDEKLCPTAYYSMDGLEGRANVCENLYADDICENCSTVATFNKCVADNSTVLTYTDSTSEVGVSRFVTNNKKIFMAGSIQPLYDDGIEADCARTMQVYETVDRNSDAVPGLTNMVVGFRIPAICDGGAEICQWSTMYAGGRLSDDTDFSQYDFEPDDTPAEIKTKQELKDSVGVDFPVTMGYSLLLWANAPSSRKIQTRYLANIDKELPTVDKKDLIFLTQYVYKPDGVPYFDVTWKLESLKNTYTDVKFFNAIDTATSGNDFGYGYLCDITRIAGGTGGKSLFQGTIAMHPSERQFEGWWVKTFHQLKQGELPEIDWSTPMSEDDYVPLTFLDDNAIAHQWGEYDDVGLEVSPGQPAYVSVRWTFDDPILQSTYGTTRSLFKITSDDIGYAEDPDDLEDVTDIDPSLYDVNFDLSYWRGAIQAYKMPKICETNNDCAENGSSANCLESSECAGQDDCPKYCAIKTCDPVTYACGGTDQICLFGFCIDGKKWETEDMDNYDPAVSSRKVFTFDTDGNRYWFGSGGNLATDAYEHMGLDSEEEAQYVINWTLGTLNADDDGDSVIIEDNESYKYDLHNSRVVISSSLTVDMMRERYSKRDRKGDKWLLGDIAHADPVFLGAHPSNSWQDVGEPSTYYSEYYGSDVYSRRKPVLLVSANDGMLHCFDAESGEELWGFVPWDVLPRLTELTKPYYEQLRTPTMDLRPVVHDAYDENTGWHTMLMVGSRGGGDHYWAMDISPSNNYGHLTPEESGSVVSLSGQTRVKFAWYYADDDLGLTYSIPTSGMFVDSSANPADPDSYPTTKWLVFFGSGYARNSATQAQKEAYFYVLDMFDTENSSKKAKLISKIHIYRSESKLSGMDDDGPTPDKIVNNVMSSAVVADAITDNITKTTDETDDYWQPDGYQDTVYIGDLAGHIFRFTVDGPIAGSSSIEGQVLFDTFKTSSTSNMEEYYEEVVNSRSLAAGAADQTYGFYRYPRPVSVQPVIWRTTKPGGDEESFLGKEENRNKIMVFTGSGKFDSFYDSFDEFKREIAEDTFVVDYQQMFAVIDHREGRVEWDDLLHNWVDDTIDSTQSPPKQLRSIDYPAAENPASGWDGWRIAFNSSINDNRGEKIITEPVIWQQEDQFGGEGRETDPQWIVFFTTFTPNMQGTCDLRTIDESGGGFLMTVQAETGRNPTFAIQDINGDSIINTTDYTGDAGYAGQKFTGSILSRVDVDPYSNAIYVKTGVQDPVMRIQSSGLKSWKSAVTSFYRIK